MRAYRAPSIPSVLGENDWTYLTHRLKGLRREPVFAVPKPTVLQGSY